MTGLARTSADLDPRRSAQRSADRVRRCREARLQLNPRPAAARGDRFAHLKRTYD